MICVIWFINVNHTFSAKLHVFESIEKQYALSLIKLHIYVTKILDARAPFEIIYHYILFRTNILQI